MSTEIKNLQDTLLRDFEEFKKEIKKDSDNVGNFTKGMLEIQDQIKEIKTSLVETKVTDSVKETAAKNPEVKAFFNALRTDTNWRNYGEKSTQGVVGTPADGGFAVPQVLDTNLTALLLESSDVRSVAKHVTIGGSTGYIHTISLSNAQTQWEGETSLPTSNSPTLGQVTIAPFTLTASPEVSQQMIEDVFFDAEAWYIAEVVKQIAIAEGTAFVNGSGSGQPKGFLQYTQNDLGANAPDYTKLNTIASVAADLVGFQDVYALPYALRPAYRKNGKYAMNRAILSQVMQLKSTTGQPLWQPSMVAGQPATLNGYQVVEFSDMPSALADNALVMTFGDFSVGYTVVDRIGTTVQRNPFINYPFVRFQTRKRVGGGLEDGQALVTLKLLAAA